MKILILNSIMFTPDGGVIPKVDSLKDTMMYNMCLGFRQSGHEVTLCAAEEYRPVKEEEYPFGIRFFRSAFTRLFPPTALPCSPELKRFLKRNAAGYDVIISSELFSFPSLYAALIAPEKTVIWQELSVHPAKFHRLPSRFWYNFLARPLMRRPLVVARSEAARDFVSQYHKNTSDKIVDHGINADRFVTCNEKTDSLAVVAQLIKRKNVDRIIAAFAQFVRHPAGCNYVLKIFGRGPLKQELKQQVRKAGIEDRVTFFGFTPHSEMVEHLSRAKASLIATSRDLNVVSIPESIVCGTPVLTNTVPNSARTVAQHNLGIVKDNWGLDELLEITGNNARYVANCVAYAPQLTSLHAAETLVNEFLSRQHH